MTDVLERNDRAAPPPPEEPLVRPWVWVVAFVGIAIGFGVLFPKQVALVGVFLALPIIIFLHETAHFVTAKRAGMKVTEFFVGFGPRIWSIRRGETEYGLKAVPFGGYCRIIGMTNLDEVDPEDEPRAYRSKRFLPKVVVAGAGPAIHFVIAGVLIFTLLWVGGDRTNRGVTTTLDRIAADSPAEAAGLQSGDHVLALDGETIDSYDQLADRISSHDAGDTATFLVERDGTEEEIDVVLREITVEGDTRVRAGITPQYYTPPLSFGEALVDTPRFTWDVTKDTVGALGKMFSLSGIRNYFGILSGDENADENQRFLSPVGATRAGVQAVEAGWTEALILVILINIFVGLFNLLPLLPFDGGHIAIATYEKIGSMIVRRPVRVDAAKLLPVTGVIVAVLAFIFLSSFYLDIVNPADNPF